MKKIITLCYLFTAIICFTACGADSSQQGGNTFSVYLIDEDGTGLVMEDYTAKAASTDTVNLINELLKEMQTGGHENLYKNPISSDIEVNDIQIKETQLSIYFSAAYNSKSGLEEILSRAAIVKTLCQVTGVDFIEFYVEDQPLMQSGNAVGLMNEDSFIDGLNESNSVQRKQVTLYLSDMDGKSLVEEPTEVTYNAAEPLAQLLIEKLIAGPENIENLNNKEVLPSVPANTVLNSVTIRDNICYIDFSKEFNELLTNVKSNVVVYSIVNTLCELSNVNKVQFTIEGEQQEKYGETTEFNTPFERNLNLVNGGAESRG